MENCQSGCEEKRGDIKKQIREMLVDKCYVIGECYDGTDPSIVPEEDIDLMADKLIAICKDQCEINTFSCHEFGSRSMGTKKTTPGTTHTEFKLDYGVTGFPADGIVNCNGTNYVFDDETYNTGTEVFLDDDDVPDLFKYNSRDTYGYPYPVSWYQYTKVKQATEWNIVVDLPSQCPDNLGERDIDGCVDDPDSENFDTYMQREEYEINDNTPTDMFNIRVNDPVKSPAKKVIVNTEEDE